MYVLDRLRTTAAKQIGAKLFRYDTATALGDAQTLNTFPLPTEFLNRQQLLVAPFNFFPVDNIPDRRKVFCLAVLVLKAISGLGVAQFKSRKTH
jgi:hypothetical protein